MKKYASLTDCISEINNTKVNNAKEIDVAMPLYNFIKFKDIYSEIFWILLATMEMKQL